MQMPSVNEYNTVALKDKYLLNIKEAAEYFGIGDNFALEIGNHIKIKRKLFEKFLDNQDAI